MDKQEYCTEAFVENEAAMESVYDCGPLYILSLWK